MLVPEESRLSAQDALKRLNSWLDKIYKEQKEEFELKPKDKKRHDEAENLKKKIVQGSLQNLLHFKATSKAKICIHKYFGNELLTNNERQVITCAFKALDFEGNGELDVHEIMNAVENYCNDMKNIEGFTRERFEEVIRMINLPN